MFKMFLKKQKNNQVILCIFHYVIIKHLFNIPLCSFLDYLSAVFFVN